MSLSSELISQFVKATKDTETTKKETTVYGTIVYDGKPYVKLDGSDLLTPVSTTADVQDGERVTVMIKNHTAIVTGNISSPAARTDDVKKLGNQITEVEILVADKVSTVELDAQKGRIDNLVSENVAIKETLTANEAIIAQLTAENAIIQGKLTANEAEIEELITKKLDASVADITYATIDELEATNVDIHNLEVTYGKFVELATENFEANEVSIKKLEADKLSATDADIKYAAIGELDATNAEIDILEADYTTFKDSTAENFTATNASIEKLEANKLSVEDADIKYANVDFSNIGKAAMEYFYANSGLIENVVIGDGTITGNLVGVTIKGDLIEGNTVVADKLVIKGEDGLYYKLNTNGETVETKQTEYNSLSGKVITAKSITAEKINVKDLVAFGATIGGFNIGENSIYSGVKESVDNTTRGVYLDNSGQVAFGDGSNFIKYYKDQNGKYRLEISADSMTIGSSSKKVETIIEDAQTAIEAVNDLEERANSGEFTGKDGEDATTLRIDSSRGTVFKNSQVSTVLSAVIYRGSQRITDIDTLKAVYGQGAYLEWSWQRLDEERFGVISSEDSRIGNGGFTFTISADDVDVKVVFMCSLNV